MKVYVIIKDDDGNFHQGAVDNSKAIIVSKLVPVFPANAFTKDLIEAIQILNENINENKTINKTI